MAATRSYPSSLPVTPAASLSATWSTAVEPRSPTGGRWAWVSPNDFSRWNECRSHQWLKRDTFRTPVVTHEGELARAEVIASLRDRHVARLAQAFNLWGALGPADTADQVHVDAVRMLREWQTLIEYCFAPGIKLDMSISEFCTDPKVPSHCLCGPRLTDVIKGWNFSRRDPTYRLLAAESARYEQALQSLSETVRSMHVPRLRQMLAQWSFSQEDSRFQDAKLLEAQWGPRFDELRAKLRAARVDHCRASEVRACLKAWNFDPEGDEEVQAALAFTQEHERAIERLEASVADMNSLEVRRELKRWNFGDDDPAYVKALGFWEDVGKPYEEEVIQALGEAVRSRHIPNVRQLLKERKELMLDGEEQDGEFRDAAAFEESEGPTYDSLCSKLQKVVSDATLEGAGQAQSGTQRVVVDEVLDAWSFSKEDSVYIEARNLFSGLQLLSWCLAGSTSCRGRLHVVCLLDQSTSIGDADFDGELKPAVREFATSLESLLGASTEVRWRVAIFPGIRDPILPKHWCEDICGQWLGLEEAMRCVDAFQYDGGTTPMHAGFQKAGEVLDELKGNPSRELVVLFTDGEPDKMEQALSDAARLRARSALMLHGVGIGSGILMSNLEHITDEQCTRMEMRGLRQSLAQWFRTARHVLGAT